MDRKDPFTSGSILTKDPHNRCALEAIFSSFRNEDVEAFQEALEQLDTPDDERLSSLWNDFLKVSFAPEIEINGRIETDNESILGKNHDFLIQAAKATYERFPEIFTTGDTYTTLGTGTYSLLKILSVEEWITHIEPLVAEWSGITKGYISSDIVDEWGYMREAGCEYPFSEIAACISRMIDKGMSPFEENDEGIRLMDSVTKIFVKEQDVKEKAMIAKFLCFLSVAPDENPARESFDIARKERTSPISWILHEGFEDTAERMIRSWLTISRHDDDIQQMVKELFLEERGIEVGLRTGITREQFQQFLDNENNDWLTAHRTERLMKARSLLEKESLMARTKTDEKPVMQRAFGRGL